MSGQKNGKAKTFKPMDRGIYNRIPKEKATYLAPIGTGKKLKEDLRKLS